MSRGRPLLVGLFAACALGAGVRAAEEAAPDEELLEFLGSFDELDEKWMEYLERTDVAKVAGVKPPAPPANESSEVHEP